MTEPSGHTCVGGGGGGGGRGQGSVTAITEPSRHVCVLGVVAHPAKAMAAAVNVAPITILGFLICNSSELSRQTRLGTLRRTRRKRTPAWGFLAHYRGGRAWEFHNNEAGLDGPLSNLCATSGCVRMIASLALSAGIFSGDVTGTRGVASNIKY